MPLIELTGGGQFSVDDLDFVALSRRPWYDTGSSVMCRANRRLGHKAMTAGQLVMLRRLEQPFFPKQTRVCHKNLDYFDNRRSNLHLLPVNELGRRNMERYWAKRRAEGSMPEKYKIARRGYTSELFFVRNAARCLLCGDEIASTGDKVFCGCRNCFVEGVGRRIRQGAVDASGFEDLSVLLPETLG